jgi:hypothetical protein
VYGQANTGANATGVFGASSSGTGVDGTSISGVGGAFASTSGIGIQGTSSSGTGVSSTGGPFGLFAIATGTNGSGVYGQANNGVNAAGVYGTSTSGMGVYGNGVSYGLYGNSTNNIGVYGTTAQANGNFAGYFHGNVQVTGNLSKGGGSFKIDDPIDPADKYLYHSFVESPDMMDIYNGNVTTDANGDATITMPDWFQPLNRDFRYQLTPIGQFAQAMVSSEIKDNSFSIKTDKPNVKVSWQVTGIRQDPYANAHRIPVEEDKPANEKGKYLYPTEYGQPASLGINYEKTPQQPPPVQPTQQPLPSGH